MIDISNHGGVFGGGSDLGSITPIVFQSTQPANNAKVDSIWVATPSTPTGKIYYSDLTSIARINTVDGDCLIETLDINVTKKLKSDKHLIIGGSASGKRWKLNKEVDCSLPTVVYIKESGIWIPKRISIFNGESWQTKSLGDGYLYRNGENTSFATGYATNPQYTKVEFKTDHIRLYAMYDRGDSDASVQLTEPVDLTNVKSIKFDIEGLSSNTTFGHTKIAVSPNPLTTPNSSYHSSMTRNGAFARNVLSLSVEKLTGFHYVAVWADESSSHAVNTTEAETRLYNVWLEY